MADPQGMHDSTSDDDAFSTTSSEVEINEVIECFRLAFGNKPSEIRELAPVLDNQCHRLKNIYQRRGNICDLEEAIEIGRQALFMTREDDPSQPTRLHNFACTLALRYQELRGLEDLKEMTEFLQRSTELLQEDDPMLPKRSDNLLIALKERYKRLRELDTLDKIIVLERKAIAVPSATSQEHDIGLANKMNNLGVSLRERYARVHDLPTLEECIEIGRQALTMIRTDAQGVPLLINLAIRISDRYFRLGALDDLEESIRLRKKAIALMSSEDPEYVSILCGLGDNIMTWYERSGKRDDFEEAAKYLREAIAIMPLDHPNRVGLLNDLGAQLTKCYEKTQVLSDLNESIQMSKEAASLSSNDHISHSMILGNLASQLNQRYQRTGDPNDIQEAVFNARQALAATPDHDVQRTRHLSSLAAILAYRYEGLGEPADLEEGIALGKEAIFATSTSDPAWAKRSQNLANQLMLRYGALNQLTDLEQSIQISQSILATISKDHTSRTRALADLAKPIFERYTALGELVDLEKAIELTREAINDETHPLDRQKRYANLSVYLHENFERVGEHKLLEEAIQISRQALDVIPGDGSIIDPLLLSNLGVQLGARFEVLGQLSDLNESIEHSRQAVAATSGGHPDRGIWLNNLGYQLSTKFERTGDLKSLDEAIKVQREAALAIPESHRNRAGALISLGVILIHRFNRTNSPVDLDDAMRYLELALCQDNAHVEERIHAGQNILVYSKSPGQAYNAAHVAINLIPKWILRSQKNSDKQHALQRVVGLATDAAAAAIRVGQPPSVALNFLERGRGVLGTYVDEMRTDIMNLRNSHPELGDRFVRLRQELEQTEAPNLLFEGKHTSFRAYTSRRYAASKEFDQLVNEICTYPEFENFLQPPSEFEIREAAKNGPIAVINISRSRCDALLLEMQQVRILPLPNLSRDELRQRAFEGNLGRPEVLEWLWDVIVGPILDALEFTEMPSGEDWPRVWWIPTGSLIQFPLHAAGYHESNISKTAIDRVVSSYSSSVRAIVDGQRVSVVSQRNRSKALLVAMESTPKQTNLPFVATEISILRNLCKGMPLDVVEPRRYKQDIIEHLPDCNIFHFAGHGHTNNSDPSRSSLLLEDWVDNPLSVGDLLSMNLRERSPFLAYLSACGTGQIRVDQLVDESIHLISACQLAGFRHVIGTLWEVNDETCVDVVRIIYECLTDGLMSDKSVSWSLHRASRLLRDKWLESTKASIEDRVGEEGSYVQFSRDILSDRNCELSAAQWAPYVHFGA